MRVSLEHDRIVRMLKESITLMCKSALAYDSELSVEGLLGITLDKKDVFLVNINQSFQPPESFSSSPKAVEMASPSDKENSYRHKGAKRNDRSKDAFSTKRRRRSQDSPKSSFAETYASEKDNRSAAEATPSSSSKSHSQHYEDSVTWHVKKEYSRDEFGDCETTQELRDTTMYDQPENREGERLLNEPDLDTSHVEQSGVVIKEEIGADNSDDDLAIIDELSFMPDTHTSTTGAHSTDTGPYDDSQAVSDPNSSVMDPIQMRMPPDSQVKSEGEEFFDELQNISSNSNQALQQEPLSQAFQCAAPGDSQRFPQLGTKMYVNEQLVGVNVVCHTGELKSMCANCGKLYNCKTTLVRHWRHVHGLQGGYCCRFCGKTFGQKSHLKDHEVSCSAQEKSAAAGRLALLMVDKSLAPTETSDPDNSL